jgi:hypothetical protein
LALERLAENETGAHPLAATFILNTAFWITIPALIDRSRNSLGYSENWKH